MPTRKANAVWNGTLKDGNGRLSVESGAFDGEYDFSSRFENGAGTNPDELLGAAEAGCFSMAFSDVLTEAGYSPEKIETSASVELKVQNGEASIPTIELECTASVSDIDDDEFQQLAEKARANCPVSKALGGVDIRLDARLAR